MFEVVITCLLGLVGGVVVYRVVNFVRRLIGWRDPMPTLLAFAIGIAGGSLFLLLVAGAVHAETCKPPNVARTVYPPFWQLVCPVEGVCRRVSQHGTETHLDVICLTPPENTRAEARVP